MIEIGAYEAKTHLPRLLEQVAKGARFVITKHGVPVAELIPAAPGQKRNTAETIGKLRAFANERKLRGLRLKELIQEGRR